MMTVGNRYLENAMFDAFVGTLPPEGVWYEYSWHEYVPVYGVKRNWWGRKRRVPQGEERVTESTGMSRLGYEVKPQRLVFERPKTFQAKAITHNLLLNMYMEEDGAVPFVSHECASILQAGEAFALTGPLVLGIGVP